MPRAAPIAALLLAAASCHCGSGSVASSDELCYGIECSGHGECAVVDLGRDVTCICDTGYFPYGLECVPDHPADADADTDVDVDSDSDADGDGDLDGGGVADADPDRDLPCFPILCGSRQCGPDGCGGTCGAGCDEGWDCDDASGVCECVPDCGGRTCGLDSRCGFSCGPCDDGICCDGTCWVGGNCCVHSDCGLCEGTPDPCERAGLEFGCGLIEGCRWDDAGCTGTPWECDRFGTPTTCIHQSGCLWGSCGTDHVCDD